MFKEGDIIQHSILGKGEVIFVDGKYFEVSFESDNKNNYTKYKLRTFTEETIKPFLIK